MASPLDRFIPDPQIRERFETTVKAPAAVVIDTVCGFDMQSIPAVRLIFRLRQKLMRGTAAPERAPQDLLSEMRGIGWELLATEPGRTMVFGAACEPWRADVTFSPVPAERFPMYAEPGRVKIAWSFLAEPLGPDRTRLIHETRAVATDEPSRLKFGGYWRWARFGIVTIRLLLMPAIRRAAERRWAVERRGKAVGSG